MEEHCFFEEYDHCLGSDTIQKNSLDRIESASAKRKVDIDKHVVETYGTATKDITVSLHKKCISIYTSKTHITRDKDKK